MNGAGIPLVSHKMPKALRFNNSGPAPFLENKTNTI